MNQTNDNSTHKENDEFLINEEGLVHINLNPIADQIIQSDITTFAPQRDLKVNTFINIIITNYYKDAQASLHIVEKNYEREIRKLFSSNEQIEIDDNIEKAIKLFVHKQCINTQEQNKNQINNFFSCNSNQKGKGRKYKLNKENYKLFFKPAKANSYCKQQFYEMKAMLETYYNESVGKYITAILEEYASKPFIEREKIYCKEIYDTLYFLTSTTFDSTKSFNSYKAEIQLIELSSGQYFEFIPYILISNNTLTHNYVMGFSPKLTPESTYITLTPTRIRLSNIKSIERKNEQIDINISDIENITSNYNIEGFKYLGNEKPENCIVRLNKVGMEAYYSRSHLRPNYTEIKESGNTYTLKFYCPSSQIRFYFFGFGENAEIIEPKEVREHLKDKYHNAYQIYSQNRNDNETAK